MKETLSREAEEAYLAVCARGGRLPPEEADPELPHLRELIAYGLLTHASGAFDDPRALIAVDPRHAQIRWGDALYRQALDALSAAERVSRTAERLAGAFQKFSLPGLQGAEGVELLRDPAQINAQVSRLLASCTRQALLAQPGGARPRDGLEAALAQDTEVIKRGVDWRTLYQTPARHDPGTRAYINAITAAGAQVRTTDHLWSRTFVIDNTALLAVPADTSGAVPSAALVTSWPVVTYVRNLFLHTWDLAEPMDRPSGREITDGTRRAIVTLLREGLEQGQIARRLGITSRTCNAHISALKKEYGVSTLFQLGAALAAAH
ncbi:winged helix-turn-helix transcriptional regulator [Streptacidiphilus monticola]|uniref:Winged helix-turn-helix transcriptional regulator n=1 Tax=Streptacidiphilus monticola TaxID=2161674 RepID=A0ABW1FW26_9ACTN